ncbi:alkaline phosphatase family protein [Bradyrhizobium oligotrophicum]|uniref:alkaline phosphatase family protein n=1 Tax=Bradyrhizobium oligotrophicum TaxID=44255 RepID=UPI003EBB48D7
MKRVVIIILDGLRRDLVSPATTPHLAGFAAQAEWFEDYRTVFPSCTRVVSASVATGCTPARHGLQGNSVALIEAGRLVLRDAGDPQFLQHKRRVTGSSLQVPTLAERVKTVGGQIVFSNVSPGAAYAHDPDGHGFVYHRAGSFGPGRIEVAAGDRLDVTLDSRGDASMTARFIDDVLVRRRPAVGVLWLGEPDHIQHNAPLGSPDHLAVLAEADRRAAEVIAAVERQRDQGEDILLLIGSDHGHQTVEDIVDIDAALITAGLKANHASDEILAISNGTSALIYVDSQRGPPLQNVRSFLERSDWAGQVFGPDELDRVGQAHTGGLAFAVSMRSSDVPNRFGIRGSSLAAKPALGKPDRLGCGQHGGLGTYEQAPFLMAWGKGFRPGQIRTSPARVTDIAPTVLSHLGLACTGMDGEALQQAAALRSETRAMTA